MAYPTDRVILHDRAGNLLPELSPEQVFSRIRTEEVNGEHELIIVTTRRMEEGWRALTVDGSGRWREWVLTEPDEAHEGGETALGTYRFVWSLQYDLTVSYAHSEAEAGMSLESDCTALEALQIALEGVSGWEAGPCDAATIEAGKGCVMIYESAWSRLSKVAKVTNGEVDAEITVSNLYGVTSRKVTLNAHVGSTEPTRRFDWGYDVSSIRRIPDPGPYYCRVVPLGRGEQEYADDKETTFEWPIDITEETGTEGEPGPYYIQDDEAAEVFKVPDGQGGWLYPTKAVSYSEDDPELLLNAATEDLHNHTRPGVTYEASVLQLAEAGMDVRGVGLGDDIHIVDRGFNPDVPLRLQGRVTRIEIDELSPETTTLLTIGSIRDGIASTMASALDQLAEKTNAVYNSIATLNTADYVRSLVDRLNAEINATGGYTYMVPGEGTVTYDTAVADPLIGIEAHQVVQIKGGSIRIANSRNTPFGGLNDWDWKTVFTSGRIASEVITAIQVVSGYIGSADNGNYWNLDNGELVLRMPYNIVTGAIDDSSSSAIVTQNGYVATADPEMYWDIIGGGYIPSGTTRYIPGLKVSRVTRSSDDTSSEESYIMFVPLGNLSGGTATKRNSIASNTELGIFGALDDAKGRSQLHLRPSEAVLCIDDGISYAGSAGSNTISIRKAGISIREDQILLQAYRSDSPSNPYWLSINGSGSTFRGDVTMGNLTATSCSANSLEMVSSSGDTYVDMSRTGSQHIGSSIHVGVNGSNGGAIYARNLYLGWNDDSSGSAQINGDLSVTGRLSCSGTVASNVKSRSVNTESYGKSLLYSYETPTPMFGDIGSGVLDEDGFCYVQIDDQFSETVHTETAYQVFLQKCGAGDVWVSEKRPTYFVVEGTPGMAFDWEMKCRQVDLENLRLDSYERYLEQSDALSGALNEAYDAESMYHEDSLLQEKSIEFYDQQYDDYVSEIERMYDELMSVA